LKVLHVCPGYFGTQLYDKLFLTLQSLGIVCDVFVCSNKKRGNGFENPYKLIVLDKEFSKVDRCIYFGKQRTIYKNICQKFSLSEFNLTHAHTLFSAGFPSYLIHKNFGLPYIVAIRETDILFFKYMFHLRNIGVSILKNAQNIIFLSPAYRDFIVYKYISKNNRQLILDKSIVIPNGIDEYFLNNKFTFIPTRNNKLIKLIYIGEVIAKRNIETTIKACILLFDKGYTVDFTIVGEIIDLKYYKIIADYGFIKYYPKCSKEEVVSYLRNSDIFIMPSVLETFGLVYAEAMSQGVPIIYSKGQGFDGQFENGVVGYAVNCFDYRDISDKIIDIYNNYQQFSERCVSLADKFNWLIIAQEYIKIYGLSTRGSELSGRLR
jgi:glycosyltransferase involved in cell wall biosynthesis